MSLRTAHSGSGVVTVLMHGSGLSSSSIAEALQFGHPPFAGYIRRRCRCARPRARGSTLTGAGPN